MPVSESAGDEERGEAAQHQVQAQVVEEDAVEGEGGAGVQVQEEAQEEDGEQEHHLAHAVVDEGLGEGADVPLVPPILGGGPPILASKQKTFFLKLLHKNSQSYLKRTNLPCSDERLGRNEHQEGEEEDEDVEALGGVNVLPGFFGVQRLGQVADSEHVRVALCL